jgi:hypothetical protein
MSKGLSFALGDRLRIRACAVRRDSRERAFAQRVVATTLGVLRVADQLLLLSARDRVEQFYQKPIPGGCPPDNRTIHQAARQGAPVQCNTGPERRHRLCCACCARRSEPILFHSGCPPQLSRAGHHPSDSRRTPTGRSDDREATRAFPPAACLARPADRARLCLSAIPHSQHPPSSLSQKRSDLVLVTRVATLAQRLVATASPETGYWNMAGQRYCPGLARYWRACVSLSTAPGTQPGNPRGKPGFLPRKIKSRER